MTMSLTNNDLLQIRTIVEDVVDRKLEPLFGKLEALENVIKEIYSMLSELQSTSITDKKFKKLTLEDKLLTLNAELLATAKQAGITLPR
jgi:hypothetical protein